MEREDFFCFFHCRFLLAPSCAFGIKTGGSCTIALWEGLAGSRTSQGEISGGETSVGDIGAIYLATFLEKVHYNIGDVNDGL